MTNLVFQNSRQNLASVLKSSDPLSKSLSSNKTVVSAPGHFNGVGVTKDAN